MKKLIFLILILSSCYSQKQLTGEVYYLTVEKGDKIDRFWLNSTADVDQKLDGYHIHIMSDSLIGKDVPYFDIKNPEMYIYCEKKGIYSKIKKLK